MASFKHAWKYGRFWASLYATISDRSADMISATNLSYTRLFDSTYQQKLCIVLAVESLPAKMAPWAMAKTSPCPRASGCSF